MRRRDFGFEKYNKPTNNGFTFYQLAMEAYDELEAELNASEDLQALANIVGNAKQHLSSCVSSENMSFMNSTLLLQMSSFGLENMDFGLTEDDINSVNVDKLEIAMEGFFSKIGKAISNTFDNAVSSAREFLEKDIKAMDEIKSEATRLMEQIKASSNDKSSDKIILKKGSIVSVGTGKLDISMINKAFNNMYSLQQDMNEKYPEVAVKYMENYIDIVLDAAKLFREHGKPYVSNVMLWMKQGSRIGFVYGMIISFLMVPFFGLLSLVLMPLEMVAQAGIFAILGILLGIPFSVVELFGRNGRNATEVSEFADLVKQGRDNYKDFVSQISKFFKSPQPAGAVLLPNEKGVELDFQISGKPAEGKAPNKKELLSLLETIVDITSNYASKKGAAKSLKSQIKRIEKEAELRDSGNKVMGDDYKNMIFGTGFSKGAGEVDTSKLQLQVKRHVLAACKEGLEYAKEAAKYV